MDLHLINRRLRDLYGADLLGQPFYRVVWSDDQTEKRFSTFRDFLPGTNIFLREVTEVREVKKYSYLEPQYVLERLFFNVHNKEILDNDTLNFACQSYEPLHCFGSHREIPWRAIEFILMLVNEPEKLTPSQMNDKEFEQAKKDEELMAKMLDEHIPNDALHSAVKDGDAILFGRSTSQMKKS